MTSRLLVCMLVVVSASFCCAEPAAPPITDKALNGTWEAIMEWEIIRMEIRSHGESYLVAANTDNEDVGVYRLVERQVHDDGQVLLRFEIIKGDWQLKYFGDWRPKGLTLQGYGYISGPGDENPELRVKHIDSLGSYDVHLTKGTIAEHIVKLSRRAGELISRQKR